MRREPLPILTRAESEIMAVLWKHGRGTVHEVVSALARPVAYTTVLTLLRILQQKGYVRHEPHPDGSRAYVYLPAVEANKARRNHVKDLIDRLFDGQPEELATGLIEDERLSRTQLEALKDQIERSLGDKRGAEKKRRKESK
ncbi:BlaI/MecI/CopY family transcriptional regulator [Sorangium sp. So ce1000]|uniref:BlaI/MecI/CopY family transcriptional regulator n=1 Tax=Sorangium sp. So ce1000 TaxID=3133325 RepID=UPI003F5DE0DD